MKRKILLLLLVFVVFAWCLEAVYAESWFKRRAVKKTENTEELSEAPLEEQQDLEEITRQQMELHEAVLREEEKAREEEAPLAQVPLELGAAATQVADLAEVDISSLGREVQEVDGAYKYAAVFKRDGKSYQVRFQDKDTGQALVRVSEDDEHYIQMRYKDTSGQSQNINSALSEDRGVVFSPNAGIQIKYIVTPRGVKENITLFAVPDKNTIEFTLNLKGFTVDEGGAPGYGFFNPDTGEELLRMEPLTMVDAQGRGGRAELSIVRVRDTNKVSGLRIELDRAFLKTAAYPITIDPTLIGTTSTPAYNNARTMVKDSSGNLWIVYPKYATGTQIYCNKSTDNGITWTNETAITTGNYNRYAPAIAIDSSNNLHVVWYGQHAGSTSYYQIRYVKYTASTTSWGTPESLTTEASEHQQYPSIAVDSSDNLHVVWWGQHSGSTTYNQIRYRKYTLGTTTWETIVNLTTEASEHQQYPSIAVDPSDNLHVVWHGQDAVSPSYDQIRYKKFTAGGAWGAISNITSGDYYQYGPCIAVDSSSNLYVAWYGHNAAVDGYQIRYLKYTDGVGWDASVTEVTDSSLNGGAYQFQYKPSVAVDTNNDIHLVWYGGYIDGGVYNNEQIRYRKCTAAGTWDASVTDCTTGDWEDPKNNITLQWSYWPDVAGTKINIPSASDRVHFPWYDWWNGYLWTAFIKLGGANIAPSVALKHIDSTNTWDNYSSYTHSNGIVIWYDLADAEQDTCKLKLEYSTDDAVWFIGTLSSTNSDGTIDNGAVDDYRQTSLSAGMMGSTQYVNWDASTLGASFNDDSVWVRLTPHDGTAAGTTITSNSFAIDNRLLGTWATGNSTQYNNGRRIVKDSSGNLHAVFYKTVRGYYQVFYAKSTDSGATWAATQLTSEASGHQQCPSIAVDSSDNLHVVWYGTDAVSPTYYQIRYVKYSSGAWGAISNITTEASEHQYNPAIAVDSSDYLHVVWHGQHAGSASYDEIRYLRSTTAGASWDSIYNIAEASNEAQYKPTLAVDSSNNIHIVWYAQHSGSTSYYQIRYIKRTSAGVWDGSVTNLTTEASEHQYYPDIAVDSSDNLHVVWYGQHSGSTSYDQIRYIKFTAGGSWGSIENLTSTALTGNNAQQYPSIAVDTADNLHVVWHARTPNYCVGYKKYTNGLGWQDDVSKLTIVPSTYYPKSRWSRWPTGNVNIPAANEINYIYYDSPTYSVIYGTTTTTTRKISTQTGNFSAAATWGAVDQSNPSIAGNNLRISSSADEQIAFTPSSAHNCAGLALHVVNRNESAKDVTVKLQENVATVWTDRASAVINTTDLPAAAPKGWIYWKFATPYAVTAAADTWRFNINTTSSTGQDFDTSDNTNLSYLEVTDTTGAPVSGDDLYIASNGTSSGTFNAITVTVDQNDTTTAYGQIEIGQNATLSFSPTATTYLITDNDVYVRGQGTLAIGTVASPIGASYTATLSLDANGADGSTVLDVGSEGMVYVQGSSSYHLADPAYTATTTTASISAGATSFTTAVATGWQEGDVIVIAPTQNGTTNMQNYTELETVSSTAGTTVNISGTISYARVSGARVMLMSRNARIQSYSSSYKAGIYIHPGSYSYGIDADYGEFRYIGKSAYLAYKCGIWIDNVYKSGSHTLFNHCSIYQSGYYLLCLRYSSTTLALNNINFYLGKYRQLYLYDNPPMTVNDCYFVASESLGAVQCWLNVTYNNCEFIGNGSYGISTYQGADLTLNNCKCYSNEAAGVLTRDTSAVHEFSDCVFGSPGTNADGDIRIDSYCYADIDLDNCLLASSTEMANLSNADPSTRIRSNDHDQTTGVHKEWQPYGTIEKSGTGMSDTTKRSGSYAIKFNPTSASNALSLALKIGVTNGQKLTPIIRMRKNATYGSTNLPNITLSRCGLTGTASMTDVSDTWVEVAITSNNTPTKTGVAALTISAQSDGASAAAFFDDLEIRGVRTVDTGSLDIWGDGLPGESLYSIDAD
ncbi:MAG: hypothetical protein D4S01_02360 [Dehalococcoidia bacterium]|nr:MAG: hypothetical protein D4S01_02360 [Dehalococcoidia bacterium]